MRILDELKQQVESEMRKLDAKVAQKKYLKITQSIKDLFLKAVVSEKQTIKAAAQRIGINYSSAKAIWAEFKARSNFKKKKHQRQPEEVEPKEDNNLRRCQYKILSGCNKIKKMFMEIKSTVAQKMSSCHTIALEAMTQEGQQQTLF